MAERYRKSYPQYFRQYRGKNGKRTHFINPRLIELVQKDNLKVEEVEPGWLNLSQAKKELHMSDKSLREVVERFRDEHSEYFRIMRGQKNQSTEYYSPELIVLIRNSDRPRAASLSNAPEGWMNLTQMEELFGISRQTIVRRIGQIRHSKDIDSRRFKDAVGKRVVYYSPDFIQALRNYI